MDKIDAPHGWLLEAVDRLRRGGLKQHALDPCAFLIYETDDEHYNPEGPIHNEVSSLGRRGHHARGRLPGRWLPEESTVPRSCGSAQAQFMEGKPKGPRILRLRVGEIVRGRHLPLSDQVPGESQTHLTGQETLAS